MTRKTITIIEDDKSINLGISIALGDDKYNFRQCYCLKDIDVNEKTDLYILDLNLPDGNGFDFLTRLRRTSQTPVLVLTANDTEISEVVGLELGADEYMTKPFSISVLRLRVEKILNRGEQRRLPIIKRDDLTLDFERLSFYKGNLELELSKTEIRLLRYFTDNQGMTLSREQVINYVWQNQEYVDENALSVTVKRLRDKLEDEEHRYITTVYGIGYVFRWEK